MSNATLSAPARHAVFANDLSRGVAAVARAIGVRQAGTIKHAIESGIAGESIIAYIFPSGDCASAIREICRLGEAAIPGLDMSPIDELMIGIDNRPVRENASSPHGMFSTLAELTLGRHLVIAYTPDEELAVERLFAALHLALCGPLPVGNWAASGSAIVGCPTCVRDNRNPNAVTNLPAFLAMAVRDGRIDPAYSRGAGTRAARLTWHVDSENRADQLAQSLSARGLTVDINRSEGIVVAQKLLERGNIHNAMTFGSKLADPNRGIVWRGAETVFTLDRPLIENV